MAAETAFPRLFEPYERGRLQLANRLVVLPHGTSMVSEGGITEDDIAYYEARARSGPALIITGASIVADSSAVRTRKLVEPYNEAVLEGLRQRVDVIHAHGVKVVGQIIHLGRETIGSEFETAPLAPSFLRSPRDPYGPQVLDEAGIAEIIEAFGVSAANLERTGHDGVEIHGAHGYLVAQFLSPATNRRSDRWGGSLDHRLRFLRAVIDSIRRHCSDAFWLGLRLSASEEIADGLEVPDTAAIAKAVAADGGVDYLSITMGTRGLYVKDATAPPATAARAAGIIREACGLPVIVGQRINTPQVAEAVLAAGQADFVGMARAFIADPDWATHAAQGRPERIRPCLGLNQDCRSFSPHLHCAANPRAGRERTVEFAHPVRAAKARRIAVIGGGPAGLEAARGAALRGHAVAVFESSDGLGGQFLYAASLPHRSELRRLIDYLQAELRCLEVTVHLGRRIDEAADLGAPFDAAVVAVGAAANALDEEWRAPHVASWFELLEQGAPPPRGAARALVVDDGSAFWWTYGVAEALVQAGWRVRVATPSAAIAAAIPTESVGPLLARLGRGGTEYSVLTALDAVTADGAALVNVASGEAVDWPCELVVVQTGRASRGELLPRLRAGGIEAHAIGDCVAPRRVSHALLEGQRVALRL
ncbi:MAG: NAD(P)-binding protein [Burkholderiales bacterium]|nr:NAD(P)-binding protein [Burkholderiales bacterium]MDE1927186.1 NAD(P)-binding protein [Burkholderiales bacterium]MDE2158435.1 NAD(P)-binding protein [Burkholderiales bacterium]MDE2505038.1 NAD(P)-binding protein [Burkholderiales bacterium]